MKSNSALITSHSAHFFKAFKIDINKLEGFASKLSIIDAFFAENEAEKLIENCNFSEFKEELEYFEIIMRFICYGKINELLKIYSPDLIKSMLSSNRLLPQLRLVATMCIMKSEFEGTKFLCENISFSVDDYERLLKIASGQSSSQLVDFLAKKILQLDPENSDEIIAASLLIAAAFNNYGATLALCQKTRNTQSINQVIVEHSILSKYFDDKSQFPKKYNAFDYYKKNYPLIIKSALTKLTINENNNKLIVPTRLHTSYKTQLTTLKNVCANPALSSIGQPENHSINKYCVVMHSNSLDEKGLVYLKELQQHYLKKTRLSLEEAINSLSCYLITSYVSIDAFKKILNKYASKVVDKEIFALYVAELCKEAYDDNHLYKDFYYPALELLSKQKPSEQILTKKFNLLTRFQKHFTVVENEEHLLQFEKALLKNSNVHKMFRLALASYFRDFGDLYDNSNPKKAIVFYKKSYDLYKEIREINKDDFVINHLIQCYTNHLFYLKKYNEVESLLTDIKCTDNLKQILLCQLGLETKKVSVEDAVLKLQDLELSAIEKEIFLCFVYEEYFKSYNFSKAIEYIELYLEIFNRGLLEKSHNYNAALTNLLCCYFQINQLDKIINFPFCDYSDQSIWQNNQNVIIISMLAFIETGKHDKAAQLFTLINDFTTAFRIGAYIGYMSLNEKRIDIKYLYREFLTELAKLNHDKLLNKQVAEALESHSEIHTLNQDNIQYLDEGMELPDSCLVNFNGGAINNFFKENKANTLLMPQAYTDTWYIKDENYTVNNTYGLNTMRFCTYKAAISISLLSKLDGNQVLYFVGSIQKGICDKAQGKNGIKFLSNGMFELKANCDIRLLAKNLYENKHGFTLILFEEMGNHKDIKRICTNQKAEVILC